jgi:hypothetical protein
MKSPNGHSFAEAQASLHHPILKTFDKGDDMKKLINSFFANYFTLLITASLVVSSLTSFRVAAQDAPPTALDDAQVVPAALTQQQKLLSKDGAAGDAFGFATAISGKMAVIGAPLADVDGKTNQGAAYLYVMENGVWIEQAKLTASDGNADSQFGYSVGIDGDTIVIGASHTAPANRGAAYVFVRNGTAWTEQAKLTGKDNLGGDRLGESVAISGNTVAAGAVLHDIAGTPDTNKGAVYLFVRNGATWTEQAKLTASDAHDYDFLGHSVAIEGDTLIAGAPQSNGNVRIGSAYVYTRTGENWSQQAKLTADDGAYDNLFGERLSLSGDTVAIGAYGAKVANTAFAGAVYIFNRVNGNWTQQSKLVPEAAEISFGLCFGIAASLKNDTLAIGAFGAQVNNNAQQGVAYLFKRDGNLWVRQSQIAANDGLAFDYFGGSVALGDNTLLVGTSQNDFSKKGTPQHGTAYYFAAGVEANTDPQIHSVKVKGKKLIVTGTNFEAPSFVYLNGERQKKSANDLDNPTTMVIGLKAGKLIAPGATVSIQVKNDTTGKLSSEFIFTRPLE